LVRRVVVVALLIAAFAAAGAAAADYYAVIIGVADYPGTVNDLRYTDDDALDLYDTLLEDSDRWKAENITLLIDSNASKTIIHDALTAIASRGDAEDIVLFYFSGHGTAGDDVSPIDEQDGYDEYLCCYGSGIEDFIRDDELSTWFEALPMERIIVILDACYSGGQIKAINDYATVKSLNRDSLPSQGDGFADDLRKMHEKRLKTQDLDDLDRYIAVLASSDQDEPSWEFGPPLNHGLFTYYLLEGLPGPADGEGNLDGKISANEAFDYLYPRVASTSEQYNLNQHPQLINLGGQCYAIRAWQRPANCVEISNNFAIPGWHMLSIPGQICLGADVCSVLQDDLEPFYIFSYDPELGGYVMGPPCDDIDSSVGIGYWVRTYDEVRIDVDVSILEQAVRLTVEEGWNQIGNPFPVLVSLNSILVSHGTQTSSFTEASNLGWISQYMFGYDVSATGYQMIGPSTGALEPWQAYWLRSYVDCDLIIPPMSPPTPPTSALAYRAADMTDVEFPPAPPKLPGLPSLADNQESTVLASEIEVMVSQNPISHTVTFGVKGVNASEVEALRIAIHDVSGHLVFDREIYGRAQEWDAKNNEGELLANGIYLLTSWVRIDGIWRNSGSVKIAVSR